LQNAISACASGQVVLVPAGTYRITAPIRVKSGVTLRGEGMGRTIIKGASGYGSRWLIGYEDPNYDWSMSGSTSRYAHAGTSKGSTQLTTVGRPRLAGPATSSSVDQLEDPNGDPPVTNDGGSGACTWCWPRRRRSPDRAVGARQPPCRARPPPTIEPALYWNYKTFAVRAGHRRRPGSRRTPASRTSPSTTA
jgi:hypothetical protein